MTASNDPERLLQPSSGSPEGLRRLFEHAERDLPSSADLARLSAKLGPLLDAPPVPSSPPGLSPLAKLGVAIVGGGILAGAWLASRPDPVPAPAIEKAERAPASATRPAAPPAPEPPAAAPSETVPEPQAAPAASPEAAASRGTEARPSERRSSGIPEDRLLEDARRALGSSPERALSLTRQHQLEFPRGVLAQEREVIAIEALRRLGRTEEAERRKERFERLYPQSAHKRKLDTPPAGQ